MGMNSAIASQTGRVFNGLGFAIPVDIVHDIVKQLISDGRVVRGYLGIEIKELDTDMAMSLGYEGKVACWWITCSIRWPGRQGRDPP